MYIVLARPNDNIIFEDSVNSAKDLPESTLPPFPKSELQDGPSSSSPLPTFPTLPPFPTLSRIALGMRPDELNSLMYDVSGGYVYNKPDIPFETDKETESNDFEGYFYDRPKNPMTFPTYNKASSTTTTPEGVFPISSTTTEEPIQDLPDGVARILRRRR